VKRSNGEVATTFEDLARVGIDHFEGIYKDDNKVNIVEIVQIFNSGI
jgi:hypothetical protein